MTGEPPPPGFARRLQENLIRFIRVLRHVGVPVNPAETLDALTALKSVDLTSRAEVRAALRATLVKAEAELPPFDRAFDLFFARPEERRAHLDEARKAKVTRQRQLAEAGRELVFQGRPLEITPEQLLTYTRLAEVQRERLRDFLAESSAGNKVDGSFQPLIESIVRGHLDRLRRELERERLPAPPATGDEDLDTLIETLAAGAGEGQPDRLLHLDMKDIDEVDLPRATTLIRRLARRLATRLSRRYRETRKRRRPNMRRTIRSNIRHGGVLFDLRFRERKVIRPRLLLICDVSGSMARYTAFILEFIFGLKQAVRGVEAFIFSEELERVTDLVGRSGPPAGGGRVPSPAAGRAAEGRVPHVEAFPSLPSGPADKARFAATARQVIEASRVWGKGTDLGAALETLLTDHHRRLTRDTVVIVVSDTKTLGADRAAGLLARMRPRLREILWLNTLPRSDWAGHRTVALFARTATMHECYTLAHLERVIHLGVGRHFRPA